MISPYIGLESQLYGVEEHRLVGGKGDGMRLLEVTNGLGLQLTLSPDRCLDVARLRYRGVNMSYFSPCGYVAPAYYDQVKTGFLKSFTAGFLTTCGLQAVGSPCVDEGEELPMHGTIGNTPAEGVCWETGEDWLTVRGRIRDEVLFGPKLCMDRQIQVSLKENRFVIADRIQNRGDQPQPVEILYHMNMGYPLLDEDSVVRVSSQSVRGRDRHAEEDLEHWMKMEPPQAGYQERCYYHTCTGEGRASIFQPKRSMGLEIRFDHKVLDCFTQWKMMGVRDYVLGLECGNCYPDGRDVMRRDGVLKFLDPGEPLCYQVEVRMLDREEE